MSLLHYQKNPFALNENMKLFQDLWDHALPMRAEDSIRVDIQESDEAFLVTADVPGFKADDIQVDVNHNVLSIMASRETLKEEEKGKYHYSERASGTFKRQFSLSEDIDHDNIKASLKDGVLKLMLPKGSVKTRKIAIEQG